MRAFAVARLVALILLPIIAFISLIVDIVLLAAPKVSMSYSAQDGTFTPLLDLPAVPIFCTALNMVISVLTIFLIVPGLWCPLFSTSRKERFLTLAWIEICWVVVLLLLWSFTATLTTGASPTSGFEAVNEYLGSSGHFNCTGSCSAALAVKILAWLNTLILLAYIVVVSGYISAQQYKRKIGLDIADDEPMIPDGPAPAASNGDMELHPRLTFPVSDQKRNDLGLNGLGA